LEERKNKVFRKAYFEFQQEPEELIREKRLRDDLYYRINFLKFLFLPFVKEKEK